MNQSLVVKLNNTAVYLISDKNISYYLSIPLSSAPKINIAINIAAGLNNNNISSIYQKFDTPDICLISPIFDPNVLLQAKTLNEQVFSYIDKCISYLINTVYKIISTNNCTVDSKIILVKNIDYQNFEDWFTKRYQSRVDCIDYTNNNSNNNNLTNNIVNNTPVNNQLQKEINPSIPVVDTVNEEKANVVLNNTQDIVTNDENSSSSSEPKDLGFVSYVLLGVVVAVAALALLYLLI